VLAIIIVSNVRLSTMKNQLVKRYIFIFAVACRCLINGLWHWMLREHLLGLASIYGLLVAPFRLLGHLGFPLEWLNNIQEILNNPETFVTIRSASYSTGANAYTTLYISFTAMEVCWVALGAFCSRHFRTNLCVFQEAYFRIQKLL
jgi:hypothetical protein